MIKGIQKVASSMTPRVRQQEVVADNIANAQTPGFKKNSVFLRYVKENQALGRSQASSWEMQMIDKVYTDYSQGVLEHTGRPLDLALENDGFFVLETPNGEAYTRNGSFTLSPEGVLVDGNGNAVLTDAGPLYVEGSRIEVDINGQIMVDGEAMAALRIVDFPQPYEFQRLGQGLYRPVDGSTPTDLTSPIVRQGYLEKANVDVLREMVDMIGSYRAFEHSQRLIQIQDESLNKAVNELGKI
jgi:flagellar basal-body rod protein FlgG